VADVSQGGMLYFLSWKLRLLDFIPFKNFANMTLISRRSCKEISRAVLTPCRRDFYSRTTSIAFQKAL